MIHNNTQAELSKLRRVYSHALISLLPLTGIYLVIPADSDLHTLHSALNTLAPLYFMAVLAMLSARVLRISSQLIWTGVFWFPVQSAVFFGFGPLVEVFGNEATQRYLSASPLSIGSTELFRANTLSTIGIHLVLLGFWLHIKYRGAAWHDMHASWLSAIPLVRLAIAMILVSGTLKYLIIQPANWSATPTIIPGSIGQIAGLTDVGFGILAYLSGKGNRSARTLFWGFWPIQFLLCSLAFSKAEIVWAMIIPLMSNFAARRSRSRLIAGLATVAILYALAQPYVHYGRGVVYERTGTITQADYVDRLEILGGYLIGDDRTHFIQSGAQHDRQGWWTRLNYAGVQANAMRLHDIGLANPSISQAWMFFIPRAIWPDKPNLSLAAVDFYRLVTGNEHSNSFLGISYYGDLYWQYGWWGVLIGAPLIGLLFASMAARSYTALNRREFVMMPAILLALELSVIGPTGAILTGVVGRSVIYFAYLLLLGILRRSLPTTNNANSDRRIRSRL